MEEKTTVPVIKTNGINEIEINDNTKISFLELGKKKVFKTSEEAKWVGIDVADIPTVKALPLHAVSDKWVSWKKSIGNKQHISKYGIGKQYTVANAIKTRAVHKKDIHSGVIRYYEAFTKEPNFQSGAYLVAVATPKILSACFAVNKNQVLYPSTYKNSNVLTYKSAIKLFINTHRIPDYTKPYHNFALFEIDIYDTQSGKVTEEPLRYYQRMNPNVFSANTLTEINIEIDEAWREKSKHKKGVKTYYAKIKTILFKNEDAFIGEKVADIKEDYLITDNPNPRNNHAYFKHTNKFKGVAPNHDTIGVVFTSEDEVASSYTSFFGMLKGRDLKKGKQHALKYEKETLGVYDTSQGTVLEGQQATFQVRYDDMEVILQKYEASKNNMLVAVGDIAYSQKSNEPCKLSKITINHKSRKQPFVLFDEDQKTKKVTDNTNLIFEIVAGQKKEEITITAQGLVIQDYQEKGKKPRCLGVTVSKTVKNGAVKLTKEKHRNDKNFIHKSSKEVFNMEQAFMLFPERIKEKNANLATSVGNEILDIARQNLSYKHTDNGIKLQVGYYYNSNYDNSVLNFLKLEDYPLEHHQLIQAFQNLWVFRYLLKIIRGEKLHQSYFIPIATCRYPNQMAQIAVYPDMKWSLNLNYNIDSPLYYENTKGMLKYYDKANSGGVAHPLFSNDASGNIRKKRKSAFDKSITTELNRFNKENESKFSLHFQVETSGSKPIDLGDEFAEKIRKMLSPILWIRNELDKSLGVSEAKKKNNSIKKNSKKIGLLKRINELPMEFELKHPSLGVGLGIGYGETLSNEVGYQLEGKIMANPIIGAQVKLDVLALGSKFKPWGSIIDILDIGSFAVNLFSGGRVETDYKIDIIFSSEIKLVGGSIDKDKPCKINYNFTDKTITGDFGIKGKIEGRLEASVEMIIKVDKKSKKGFSSSISNTKSRKEKQKAFELGVGIESSSWVSLKLGKEFGKGGNFNTEFYFSGVSMKVWIKAGFAKKNDVPEIIPLTPPVINKEFNIF